MTPEVRAYLVAALWSSTDDDGEPLDRKYSPEDFAPESLAQAAEDVARFTAAVGDLLPEAVEATGQDWEQVWLDLWFTSRRHGVGFWEREWGAYGDRLTAAAHLLSEECPYIGDDGRVYLWACR